MLFFWLKFVRAHNTISHAEVAHSTELSHHVKQCVLATLKRVSILTPRFFYFWTPHFSVSTPHFGWAPRLNYTMPKTSLYLQLLNVATVLLFLVRWNEQFQVRRGDGDSQRTPWCILGRALTEYRCDVRLRPNNDS